MSAAVEYDWLGIDFGTCFSSAARIVDGRPQPVKEPLRLGYSVPSSVFVAPGDSGELIVGIAAENQKIRHPDRFETQFKRVLGRAEPIPLGERRVGVDELVAAVLSYLRKQGEEAAGRELLAAVITVPASYEAHLRERMLEAARAAGFERVELLEEPVAAIVEYAAQAEVTGNVLVYDLGGGTFDAVIVNLDGDGPRVIGYDGLPDVGGSNFDQAIERDLAERGGDALVRALEGVDSEDGDVQMTARRTELMARDECRRIKHDLSDLTTSSLSFVVPAGVVAYELSRERLEELVAADLRRTIDCCEGLLERSGAAWEDLSGVLMVGGSCRLPFIGEALARRSSRPLWRVTDPELAVCSGAALHAARLSAAERRDLTVDAAGGGDHTSIAAALEEASPGTTVRVRPGSYAERVVISRALTLAGDDFRAKVVLQGDAGPVVTLAHPGARLAGVSVRTAAGPGVVVGATGVELLDCDVHADAGPAVEVSGTFAATLRGNRLSGASGALVLDGARAELEHNAITGTSDVGVAVVGDGSSATIRGGRVVDGAGSAVVVDEGAEATLEGCELARHEHALLYAAGAGTIVRLVGCRVVDGAADGVHVAGATVRLEDSEIAHNGRAGIVLVDPCGAVVLSNEVCGNATAGIELSGGGAEVHGNRIAGNGELGVFIASSPDAELTDNRIEGNGGDGVRVDGPAGRIEHNLVTGNRLAAIRFLAPGAVVIAGNLLGGNGAGALGGELPGPGLGANDLGFPDGYVGIVAELAGALERGELLVADQLSLDAVLESARGRVDSGARAGALSPDLLRWLDVVWRHATEHGLRGRAWVTDPARGATTRSFGSTHLEKRLRHIGL